MKFKFIILGLSLLFILFNSVCFSQNSTMWDKIYGGMGRDHSRCIKQTSDGGYVIIGGTKSFGPGPYSNAWLLRLDSFGDTIFTKIYTGDNSLGGSSIVETYDSCFIFCGIKYTTNGGDNDVWVVKIDSHGDTIWTKTFGNSMYYEHGLVIQNTIDGGYAILSQRYRPAIQKKDLWFIKINDIGDSLWTRNYSKYDWDYGNDFLQTRDEGYLIVGSTDQDFSINYASDIWLIKTNKYGDTTFTKTYGLETTDEYCYSIDTTDDNGYILTGTIYYNDSTSYNSSDMLLIRINEFGDTLWTKYYGGNRGDDGNFVVTNRNYNYLVVGKKIDWLYDLNLWIVEFSSSGEIIWSKTYGSSSTDEWAYYVQETSDKGYVVIAKLYLNNGDIWVIKTDSLGNTTIPVGVDEDTRKSFEISLTQNYPNPFNPNTTIKYQIPENSFITLKVYDVLGNEIETLVNEEKPAGSYEVEFQSAVGGRQLASGIYFFKLQAGNFIETKKMVLLK